MMHGWVVKDVNRRGSVGVNPMSDKGASAVGGESPGYYSCRFRVFRARWDCSFETPRGCN